MKKVLSVILAVALIFSVMCVNVFAAEGDTTTGKTHPDPHDGSAGTYWVVGEQDPESTDLDNGVAPESFGTPSVGANVSLNFTHTTETDSNGNTTNSKDVIQHRYAIDITYSDLVINLGDVITKVTEGENTESYEYYYRWNVNTYKYDLVDSQGNLIETDPTTETELKLDGKHTFNAFTITNHSDQAIYYKAEAELDKNETAEANMVLTADTASDASVAKARVQGTDTTTTSGGPTTSTMQTLSVTPASGLTWLDVVNNLMAGNVTSETVVGTLTVTVSMTAFTTGSTETTTPTP